MTLPVRAFALSDEQQDKPAMFQCTARLRSVSARREDATYWWQVVIRAGDLKVIDGSVRGKIAKLAEALKS